MHYCKNTSIIIEFLIQFCGRRYCMESYWMESWGKVNLEKVSMFVSFLVSTIECMSAWYWMIFAQNACYVVVVYFRRPNDLLSMFNPLTIIKTLICVRYKWCIIKFFICLLLIALLGLFLYSTPVNLCHKICKYKCWHKSFDQDHSDGKSNPSLNLYDADFTKEDYFLIKSSWIVTAQDKSY